VIGGSSEESRSSQSIPAFVLKITAEGKFSDSKAMVPFLNIFETLKGNDFRIIEKLTGKKCQML
jgi:hypothetical protein